MPRRPELQLALALALITAALYARTTWSGFVYYDDDKYVIDNSHVQQGLSVGNIRWALTTFDVGNWHPLTWLSYLADSTLFGPRPGPMHAVNAAVHIANSLLLFELLKQMSGSVKRSALAAALFAIHPLHVESVAWISERKDVLSTLFVLLAMLAYVSFTRAGARQRALAAYAGSLLLFALALMAKPMAVTLPAVLLLIDYWPLERLQRLRWRCLIEKIPFAALSLASCIVTYRAQSAGGMVQTLRVVPLAGRLANALVSYATYIAKTIFPIHLEVPYPLLPESIAAWKVILAAIVLIAFTALAIVQARCGRRYVLAGWLWYVVTLLPVIGIVQVGDQAMADRYTYLPLIGLFIVLVWAWGDLERKRMERVGVRPIANLIVGALATLWLIAFIQVGYWRNTETLFGHAIKVDADNYLAMQELALYRSAHGDPAGAEDLYERALLIRPDAAMIHYNRGNNLLRLGRPKEAFDAYSAAIALKPDFAEAHANLGWLLLEAEQRDAAEREFRTALKLKPRLQAAETGLARLQHQR